MRSFLLLISSLFSLFLWSNCTRSSEPLDQNDNKQNSTSPYFQVQFNPELPGCGDCHQENTESEQTLASVANKKWEDHKFDISSDPMTINDCLLCHFVDNEGVEGSIAPTPLRTIVHRDHMNNGKFEGNCFTCHIIKGESSPDLYINYD